MTALSGPRRWNIASAAASGANARSKLTSETDHSVEAGQTEVSGDIIEYL